MRLINIYDMRMKEFMTDVPKYAILFHRWGPDEITFKEYQKGADRLKAGYRKIEAFCKYVEALESKNPAGIDYIWIDTGEHAFQANTIAFVGVLLREYCSTQACIDKRSSAELSESINSMYQLYADAEYCVAYLSDVEDVEDLAASEWFTRGWTASALPTFCM